MVIVVDDRLDVMGDVMGWQIDEAYCGDSLYGDGLTIWLLVWWWIGDVIVCMVTDWRWTACGDGLTMWLLVWWRIDDVIACTVTDWRCDCLYGDGLRVFHALTCYSCRVARWRMGWRVRVSGLDNLQLCTNFRYCCRIWAKEWRGGDRIVVRGATEPSTGQENAETTRRR